MVGWKQGLMAFALVAAAFPPAIAAPKTPPAPPPGPPMIGFSPENAAAQRALEAKFDANLSAAAIRARLQQMSSEPNQVGSPHDKANAEFTLAQFKAWGWDAHIEVFNVLYPTPLQE